MLQSASGLSDRKSMGNQIVTVSCVQQNVSVVRHLWVRRTVKRCHINTHVLIETATLVWKWLKLLTLLVSVALTDAVNATLGSNNVHICGSWGTDVNLRCGSGYINIDHCFIMMWLFRSYAL